MAARSSLPTGKSGQKRFPEQQKTGLQEMETDVAGSREETYFTLLINIYSLNLFQAVI
ncbi:hypothetical protein [Chlorobaculum parvum]|uniref:hypothetical protein n=1 Tax=Chlorobaculum parvum TaxID=274539 RepID=UPI0012E9C83A|nr:hypothetical protein [Chlorobaculum parvum]